MASFDTTQEITFSDSTSPSPRPGIVCHSLLGGLWENEAPVEGLDFPGWEKRVFGGYLRRCDLRSNEGVTHFLVGSELDETAGCVLGIDADLDTHNLFQVVLANAEP